MKTVSLFVLTLAIAALISMSPAKTFSHAQPAGQGKVDELLKKGDDLYKAGKFKEAIDAYKEVLAQDANNDRAIAYIAFSYYRLHDNEQARQWMKRRVEIPGLSPSTKNQVLTDMTLLYWDDAHLRIATRLAAGTKTLTSEETVAVKKLLTEGIDSAQKAVTIAPRSVKGFNLLNLLYRASAAIEGDGTARTDLLSKADAALRKSVEIFEANPQQQTSDLWTVPTISTVNGNDLGQAVHLGAATKKTSADGLKDAKEGEAVVEVVVGRDGKVRLPRALSGQGKLSEAAVSAARQWEFEPSTFEGHAVQVIETISFPAK
ncbi:MAG TPA: energy transducer TonB [Blastocatellia bacterium]|nr:energy transducer TonB [Blastocatellia bacterium]